MELLLGNRKVKVKTSLIVGQGGEAVIYRLDSDTVLKLFKGPDHPDFAGLPQEQEAARLRLELQQKKLPAFPKGLPAQVVAPEDLAREPVSGMAVGFSMRFVPKAELLSRYSERPFRQAGVDPNSIPLIFARLHDSVSILHRRGVLIGDFNDLNVLVREQDPFLIDADSFQYGGFPCVAYTLKYSDSKLFDEQGNVPVFVRPYQEDSDWYSFAVLLFQCLLFVDPFGGVHAPKDPGKRVPNVLRALRRVPVFDSEVRYPKTALPYCVLPDELLQFFYRVFAQGARGRFPADLLKRIEWTNCPNCGSEHARPACPFCSGPGRKTVTVVASTGNLLLAHLFETRGALLHVGNHLEKAAWIEARDEALFREHGEVILSGQAAPGMRFAICGEETLIGQGNSLAIIGAGKVPEVISVDNCEGVPQFAVGAGKVFFSHGGFLYRRELVSGIQTRSVVGKVLAGQTRFWVGSVFGFGFYRASDMTVAFTFPSDRQGFRDKIGFVRIRGQIVQAECRFSDRFCWCFISSVDNGKEIRRCTVFREDGTMIAYQEDERSEIEWMAPQTGKVAIGKHLFCLVDQGILRLEFGSGSILPGRLFSIHSSVLEGQDFLGAVPEGLVIAGSKRISLVQIGR